MGIFDLVRRSLASPATRRIRAAAEASEVWASAPAPSRIPPSTALAVRASNGLQGPARTPPIQWMQDQPPSPPSSFAFAPGYNDHTYQNFSAPQAFDGFSLDRIRAAVTAHRVGIFWETSALMVAVLGFAPCFAALKQAIAPIVALPRHVHGGDKGLARFLRGEIEDMIIPRGGLLPSPYFPPTLWGWTAIQLRMMGFAVWQHVDGDPDPETGVRPRFTRPWEPWATMRTRSPRKTFAMATSGNVEICNDGKFTLIESTIEGHLHDSAICALGEPTLAGKLTEEARTSFLDFFGKPKLFATLPANVPTEGQAGDQALAAVNTIYGPDGRGVLPNGMTLDAVSVSAAGGADAFSGALLDSIVHLFMVLTGSAGTIGNGMSSGAGTGGHGYQPAKGGSWGVRHDLVADPVRAIVCGVNQGVVAPHLDINYAESIRASKKAGAWKSPIVVIPLSSPDKDERIAADIDRHKAYVEQLKAEQDIGAPPNQDRAEKLAERFEVLPLVLARGVITKDDMDQKLFAPDEYRAQKGFDALPGDVGSIERLAEDRGKGADEIGALPPEAAPAPKLPAPPAPDARADTDGPATQRSSPGVVP